MTIIGRTLDQLFTPSFRSILIKGTLSTIAAIALLWFITNLMVPYIIEIDLYFDWLNELKTD